MGSGAFVLPRMVQGECTAPALEDATLTIDKSLQRKGRLERTRNVLTRGERIERLKFEDRWEDGRSPFGLPKVRVMKATLGRKKKKKVGDEEGAELIEGEGLTDEESEEQETGGE